MSEGLRIRWLYTLQIGKLLKKGVCIIWWDSSSKKHRERDNPFVAITPSSIMPRVVELVRVKMIELYVIDKKIFDII